MKLTREQKIKAAAELDGWKIVLTSSTYDNATCYRNDGALCYFMSLSYDTSYDAIIPLIQKQSDAVKSAVNEHLYFNIAIDKRIIDATPSQLLDALLIATGKMTI